MSTSHENPFKNISVAQVEQAIASAFKSLVETDKDINCHIDAVNFTSDFSTHTIKLSSVKVSLKLIDNIDFLDNLKDLDQDKPL